MEPKVYLLCGEPSAYGDSIVVAVYSHEYLAAAECVRLNNRDYPNATYYVETRELLSA